MDFELPQELADYLVELDEFIEREIKPLEEQDDNVRFFDHRREDARTDWANGGVPSRGGEGVAGGGGARGGGRRVGGGGLGGGPGGGPAAAGHYRYPFPPEFGGRGGS